MLLSCYKYFASCRTLWHGSADFLFGLPIQFVSQNNLSDSDSECGDLVTDDLTRSSNSSIGIEANAGNDFSQRDKFQMRAQVIGFGFYINKTEREINKEKASYVLVPHVGFSREKICYRFYDSVNDILLETEPVDVFMFEKKICPLVILLTWLVLNYKVISEGTPACLIGYKSGFHEMFPKQLAEYKEEIEHPCHVEPSLQKEAELPYRCVKYGTCDYEEEKKRFKFKLVHDL